MEKKIIVKISEGLGNQLFMYAHAYFLSKKMNRKLLIDDTSGFFQYKNKLRGQKYLLNRFKINLDYANKYDRFDTNYKNFIKKFYIYFDKFKKNKSFLNEHIIKKNKIKIATSHTILEDVNFAKNIFVQGNFENPNYFNSFYQNLVDQLKVKESFLNDNSKIIDKLSNSNSVSIHVRQHRFSDQKLKNNELFNNLKSEQFTDETLKYIAKSVTFFKKKLLNPSFFIWSNNFDNLESFILNYSDEKFTFIKENDDINDFHLFKFAKHFIVGPSTFHWWGAWLNENAKKICLRPNNLNPSNNKNFWPNDWIKI